jgi:hypothetical protein
MGIDWNAPVLCARFIIDRVIDPKSMHAPPSGGMLLGVYLL